MSETHPGKILCEQFMSPMRLSAQKLASKLDVSCRTVSDIINETRGISAEMALRLAKFFGTTPEYWLELQMRYELMRARQKLQMDDETKFDTIAFSDLHELQVESKTWKEQMLDSNFVSEDEMDVVFRIYERLGFEPVVFDHIVSDLGLFAGDVVAFLGILEMEGWVKRLPGNLYIRAK